MSRLAAAERFARRAWIPALLAAYFFLVSWDSLKAPFAADEMSAIYWYWHPSPWRLLVSQFMLWVGYVRPLGAVFFLPVYLLWGLSAAAYHGYLLLLLLIGAWQMWRLARALGCGELPAGFVALIGCYHGGLENLYYNGSFAFDALCGIFFFASLAYYARIRGAGALLTGRQTAAFLGLYLCALNSKEMAITMPAILLAYEWLFHPPPGRRASDLAAWLRGPGQVLCWASLLALLSLWGKAFGRFGLLKQAAYRPVYSWGRFADFQERHLGDIFYHPPRFGAVMTLALAALVTYLAWRRKQPLLRFCWFYILVTPLPIAFLENRDQACLYVTLAGWAVLAAKLFEDWLPAAARTLAAEPAFRGLGARRARTLIVAAAATGYAWLGWDFKRAYVHVETAPIGTMTAQVLAEFRRVNPRVPPASTVVFLDDPWPYTFDMSIIAELWFRDRATRVLLPRKTPVTESEIARADAVFTWRDNRLVRLR